MNYFNKIISILIAVSFSMIQASPGDSIVTPIAVIQQSDSTSDSTQVLKTVNPENKKSLTVGQGVGIGCCIGVLGAGILVAIVVYRISHMFDNMHINPIPM